MNNFVPIHLIKHTNPWPLEAVRRLQELHPTGMSYSKIADILNEEFKGKLASYLNRNSISGKVKRLNMSNPERKESLRYINRKRKLIIEEKKEDTKGGISLFEIRGNQCRHIAEGQSLCCGQNGISFKKPYCEYHAYHSKKPIYKKGPA